MSLTIGTNLASLASQRQLSKLSNKLGVSYERLSSGLRVNSAKDDAGGISISTRVESQIRGTNQAILNVNDAISMVQIAEGGTSEVINIIQRIRELAVQGSSGGTTQNDRKAIYQELTQLADQMDLLSGDGVKSGLSMIKYNGMSLSDESQNLGDFSLQVGNEAGETLTVEFADIDEIVDQTVDSNSIDNIVAAGYSTASFEDVITKADSALSTQTSTNHTGQLGLLGVQAHLGSTLNRLESILTSLQVRKESTSSMHSRIKDADIAHETAELTKNTISQNAGVAILAQANQQPSLAMSLLG
ncbi:MAG: flagellin FliC [Magnetococcales bacterium]|nr:flagellin FliC [Magnetococcales bacterium]